ncbi:MAG: hypothetical protein APF82_04025 [Sphingomonadales bacterium BRH_c42]|nr:MAG: hypothetical protein APF82_04025 [Sphingomonadales bacterium BRH_c42]
MIRVVFLGKLADIAGTDADGFALPDDEINWDGLLALLGPQLAEAVRAETVKLALNGTLLPDKAALIARAGDEIALLPPVSGG